MSVTTNPANFSSLERSKPGFEKTEETTYMKNYTQVYVKNSMEAAKTYCKAFGAEITL